MPQKETTWIEPFVAQFDLEEGTLLNASRHLVRTARDMRGYYADEAALEKLIAEHNNPVHYEVFEIQVPEEYGHLLVCISKLQPGCVGEECFMTKGHYHSVRETGEVYLGLRGHGLLMMKTEEGHCRWQTIRRGHMVYVPPFWAHRSVNTGDEALISLCVYPANAGHNYGDIEREGFPKRVFRRGGELRVER